MICAPRDTACCMLIHRYIDVTFDQELVAMMVMSPLRSGKRGAAAKEAASLPEAKKPTKLSHVMQRISMMKRKSLGVNDVTFDQELVAMMVVSSLRSGKRGAAATEAASLPEAKKPKVSHVMERVPYVLQDQI